MVSVVVVIKVSTYKGHNTVLLLKKEYIYKTFIEMMHRTKTTQRAVMVPGQFAVCLILFIISHFINLLDSSISNEVFCILILFSMSFFVFHYGRNIAIWFTTKINNNTRDELLFKWYNFCVNCDICIDFYLSNSHFN